MPIHSGSIESPLDEFRRRRQGRELERVERVDVGPLPDLFGDVGTPATKPRQRPRQQVVYCERCKSLDSVFLGGGKSVSSVRCARCGGEVTTHRGRSAKLALYDAIMQRCLDLTIAAAHGDGDITVAVEYAEYAAHTAFALRLVAYGPEPSRK